MFTYIKGYTMKIQLPINCRVLSLFFIACDDMYADVLFISKSEWLKIKRIFLILILLNTILSADFIKINDIVSDSKTDLIWQNNMLGTQVNWEEAIEVCDSLLLEGYEDWRLPTLTELMSLIDEDNFDPAIDAIFNNTASSQYWSSTTHLNNRYYAWFVNFFNGTQEGSYKNNNYYVRCVRRGKKLST